MPVLHSVVYYSYKLQEMAEVPKSPVRTATVHDKLTDLEELQHSFQSENQDHLPCQDKKEREPCQASRTERDAPDAVVFLKGIYYYYTESKR